MTQSHIKRGSKKSQSGFSLVEALIVVAIIFILSAVALISTQQLLTNYKADAAASVVTTQLRAARQLAISRRHNVQITFTTTVAAPDFAPSISYQQITSGLAGETVPAAVTVPLPPYSTFTLQTGQGDTPMGFGNVSPVYIGGVSNGPPNMYFSTNGSFVAANAPINGTFFVGTVNKPSSARAVTILGSTGRIRTYYWTGVSTTSPSGWRE